MSEFQFAKRQRVTVPAVKAGAPNVQGIVALGVCKMGEEPSYVVQFLDANKVDEAGCYKLAAVTVTQSELMVAQPPKMMPIAAAESDAKLAYSNGRHDVIAEIEAAREARRRKRKPAGKTKPKSKRNR